jgi:DNA polymerase III gamma/tau subunit
MLDILKLEKIDYESRALDTIITLADGGVRDALSLLDQVIAYSGAFVNEKDILELFGLAGTGEKINLLRQIAQGDTVGLLKTLEQFTRQGVDIKRLVADLLDILKDLLIYLKTSNHDLLTKVTANEADDLLQDLDYELVPIFIDLLLKTQSDFRFVANVRSLVEVIFLKMGRLEKPAEPTVAPVAKPKESTIKPLATVSKEAPAFLSKPKLRNLPSKMQTRIKRRRDFLRTGQPGDHRTGIGQSRAENCRAEPHPLKQRRSHAPSSTNWPTRRNPLRRLK